MTNRTRRGNQTVIFAFSLPVILGFTALALDFGMVAVARTQAQSAADSAALAGAAFFRDAERAKEVSDAYAEANGINDIESVLLDSHWTYGEWNRDNMVFTALPDDEDANAVKVGVKAHVPMHFGGLFGMTGLDVVQIAGAGPTAVKGRAPDTVIVLDVSGSMEPDEMGLAREAAVALVDCVAENSSADSRVSVVAFAATSKLILDWHEYGTNYTTIRSTINQIYGCSESSSKAGVACTGTSHGSGYGPAIALLDEAALTSDEEVGKVVVYLSDGAPHASPVCTSTNYSAAPWGSELQALCNALPQRCITAKCPSGYTSYDHDYCAKKGFAAPCCVNNPNNPTQFKAQSSCKTQGKQPLESNYVAWTQAYQEQASDSLFDVYTVYYGPKNDIAGRKFMENNVRTGLGFSLDTPNAAAIGDAFVDICLASLDAQPGLLF